MSVNDRVLLDSILKSKREDIAPEMRDDDFFELFLAEQLLWDRDLSWDELRTGLIGGGDDGGLDAVYIFCKGDILSAGSDIRGPRNSAAFELVLIQAKTSQSFTETAVEKIHATLARLLDFDKPIEDSSALFNAQLIAWFELFREAYIASANRFPSVGVKIYYGSRGFEVNPKVKKRARDLCEVVKSLFSASACSFDFITPSALVEMARRRRPSTLDIKLAEVIAATGDGFVGLASIGDYFDFITNDKGELQATIFDSNVRDYEGNSVVNASIRKTLEDRSEEDFWWLNNGVTIVASRAAQHGGKVLTLEHPEIVNGLQTSREIYNYVSKESEDVNLEPDRRTVLIRVVVPGNDASRDRIIRATNSQTTIPSVALRATDRIQRDIEEYFLQHGWFYERRKNRYQNEGKPISRIVTIPYLAESVLAAILSSPHLGNPRVGGRFLRDDKVYDEIFNSSISLPNYLRSAQLSRLVESHINGQYLTWRAGQSASDPQGADVESRPRPRTPRPSRSQRYLLPAVMVLSVTYSTGGDLASLDINSITANDIAFWLAKAEELDPVRAVKRMKSESAEAQLIQRLLNLINANASAAEVPE
jgi:hypothetical protein